jgi:hypothetical protein
MRAIQTTVDFRPSALDRVPFGRLLTFPEAPPETCPLVSSLEEYAYCDELEADNRVEDSPRRKSSVRVPMFPTYSVLLAPRFCPRTAHQMDNTLPILSALAHRISAIRSTNRKNEVTKLPSFVPKNRLARRGQNSSPRQIATTFRIQHPQSSIQHQESESSTHLPLLPAPAPYLELAHSHGKMNRLRTLLTGITRFTREDDIPWRQNPLRRPLS